MKEYNVPCTWMMSGVIKIIANSLDDAVVAAKNKSLPEGTYIDNSFMLPTKAEIANANRLHQTQSHFYVDIENFSLREIKEEIIARRKGFSTNQDLTDFPLEVLEFFTEGVCWYA